VLSTRGVYYLADAPQSVFEAAQALADTPRRKHKRRRRSSSAATKVVRPRKAPPSQSQRRPSLTFDSSNPAMSAESCCRFHCAIHRALSASGHHGSTTLIAAVGHLCMHTILRHFHAPRVWIQQFVRHVHGNSRAHEDPPSSSSLRFAVYTCEFCFSFSGTRRQLTTQSCAI